jgi:hypothetical protein
MDKIASLIEMLARLTDKTQPTQPGRQFTRKYRSKAGSVSCKTRA